MSNRQLSIVFFFLLNSFQVTAQNRELDSLRNVLAISKVDSLLFDANRLMAMNLWETHPDSAIIFGYEALEIAKKIKDDSKIAMGFQAIGVAYDYKDNLDSCLFFLNEGLAVYKKAGNDEGASHILSDIAIAYYFRGNYELALRNHFTALEFREKSGNKRFIAISYNNIGLVYRSRKEYGNAALYYQKSLKIKRDTQDEQGVLNSLINIGSAFQSQGKYDSAFYYANEALKQATKIKAGDDILASQINMGAAMVSLGRYDEALILLKEAEKKSIDGNLKKNLLSVYESLGDVYSNKGLYVKADEYYMRGLDISSQSSRMEQKGIFLRKLAKNSFNKGDYKQAYSFSEQSKQISDTLFTDENSRQINEMAAIYETGEKEKKIEKLNSDNIVSAALAKRRKKERNYFIIASALFLGMAWLAYRAFASNKKKKEQLATQNSIIEKSLTEKEFLMKEIHHRVKNNLQVVSSLLKLQSHYIKDEQAQEAVKDSRNRVQSMALIHQNLYQDDNLTGIDVQDYISKLCENLFQSYNIHPHRIKLIKEIEPLNLDVDTVVPVGLILNELITNSLKYGFPGEKEGAIKIIIQEDNSILKLKVFDNGVGLPDDFQTRFKETFGYKMIQTFIQKMKGELKTYSEDGTKVEITITNYKPVIL
jgi:two-component system, sensor histidine kinase PdtaS